jgi:glycine betaine catabolism B
MPVPESQRYQVAFRERVSCGESTASFRFDKPEGYDFAAGQYFSLTLPTREGEQTKHFTHSEAPLDAWVELTTRLSGSAFKDALVALVPGTAVGIEGPRGRLTIGPDIRRVAFLVGGIGVTPARSIVRDAVQRSTGLEVAMFYGNQDATCIPFRDEFAGYEADHPEIRVIDVLFQPPEGWTGETGFITAEVVRRHVDPLDGWHWVVAGPPPMIAPMKTVLADLEIPAERISLESFTGYEQ